MTSTSELKFQQPAKLSREFLLELQPELVMLVGQSEPEKHAELCSHVQKICRQMSKERGEIKERKSLAWMQNFSLTYIEDVQGGDVRGSWAKLIGRFHPNLIRSEEGDVAGDVAGVTLVSCAVILTLLLFPVPSGHKNRGPNLTFAGAEVGAVFLAVCTRAKLHPAASEWTMCFRYASHTVYLRAAGRGGHLWAATAGLGALTSICTWGCIWLGCGSHPAHRGSTGSSSPSCFGSNMLNWRVFREALERTKTSN